MNEQPSKEHKLRIGIDIGGTFTDVVAQIDGRFHSAKVPSTYPDPSGAVANALETILERVALPAQSVTGLAHGTTVATNAAIERRFATVGLLTTRGFRDVLEIGRQTRPELYNLNFEPNPTLIARRLRREIGERIDAHGEILVAPDRAEAIDEAKQLIEDGATAICVCFINSYVNSTNELLVASWLRAEFPSVQVWASAEVVAEFREYERFSTTALNAALGPVMVNYLERFANQVGDTGVRVEPTLMHSAGGITRLAEAATRPTSTLLSGPAAGVLGAIRAAQPHGEDHLLTFDMGGTSTDLSVVYDSEPEMLRLRYVERYPVLGSSLAISTIGAGGGSIAWVDGGGRLRVGPRSASSRPGPAAYGHGGLEPTVTDAHVVIGNLPANLRLGKALTIDRDAAVAAMERVATPLGLTTVEAARAVLAVVNTNMALAARQSTVARGIDPRDYTLVAFGGAGPLHAVELARELGISRLLIPTTPGTMCAMGLLVSDLETEFTRTRLTALSPTSLRDINAVWDELSEPAEDWTERQTQEGERAVRYQADIRYRGQDHSLTVAVAAAPWDSDTIAEVANAFRAQHLQRNGYAAEDEAIEIENYRVLPRVMVSSGSPTEQLSPAGPLRSGGPGPRASGEVPIWGEEAGPTVSQLFHRADLEVGDEVNGPALIIQDDTTIVIPPFALVTVLFDGTLICDPDVRITSNSSPELVTGASAL